MPTYAVRSLSLASESKVTTGIPALTALSMAAPVTVDYVSLGLCIAFIGGADVQTRDVRKFRGGELTPLVGQVEEAVVHLLWNQGKCY